MVLVASHDRYDRVCIRFSSTADDYLLTCTADVGVESVNFIVLDTGVSILLCSDGSIEMFLANPKSKGNKTISNTGLHGSEDLYCEAGILCCVDEGGFYSLHLQ